MAQAATDKKSNEITAIPKLLDLLDLRGAVVCIDAAGCQKSIAESIVAVGGDCVLALKGNQGALHGCAKKLFVQAGAAEFADSCEEADKGGRGRVETRRLATGPSRRRRRVPARGRRLAFPSIRPRILATRTLKGKTSAETRYDVSSIQPDAQCIAKSVRSHWDIENSLHWTQGVAFNEDASRIRTGNAPFAMAVTRHIALNLVQTVKRKSESVVRMRKKAARCDETLKRILNAINS